MDTFRQHLGYFLLAYLVTLNRRQVWLKRKIVAIAIKLGGGVSMTISNTTTRIAEEQSTKGDVSLYGRPPV